MNACFASLSAICLLSGCCAGVSVRKVTKANCDSVRGLRVYLPERFLVGRPGPTGKIDWKIEMWGDPDEEYAVHAWSFLAKNNAHFTRTPSGLLTKVSMNADAGAVASQLAKALGDVGGAAIDPANTQQTAAAKDAGSAADKAKAAGAKTVDEKKQDVTEKDSAAAVAQGNSDYADQVVEKLKTDLTEAKQSGDAASIKDAKANLASAEGAQHQAKNALNKAKADQEKAKAVLADAKAKEADAKTIRTVHGVIIYRIVEDPETGIRLEPLKFSVNGELVNPCEVQATFKTWGAKPKADQ